MYRLNHDISHIFEDKTPGKTVARCYNVNTELKTRAVIKHGMLETAQASMKTKELTVFGSAQITS